MRITRDVFVGTLTVSRHVRRTYRVAVWRRVRSDGRQPCPPDLWSAAERSLMAELAGRAP